MIITLCLSMAETNTLGSNLGAMTIVAPPYRAGPMVTFRANRWYKGSWQMVTDW